MLFKAAGAAAGGLLPTTLLGGFEALEQPACAGVPAPPEVIGKLSQSADASGQHAINRLCVHFRIFPFSGFLVTTKRITTARMSEQQPFTFCLRQNVADRYAGYKRVWHFI